MNTKWRARVAGGAAGLINGFFGGGGGLVFLPLMSRDQTLSRRQLFATCIGVILPVCVVSATVYFFRADLSILTALPYLLGGLIGGLIGGFSYEKVPVKLLKWLFAGFLFYAGVKYLL
jgi:uncharacterized membrane protein YfcA